MIEFDKVNKWYGEHHVLTDIDLHANKGEVVVVCGPSGSGKSTMIRTINRLEEIQQGRICVNGQDIHGRGVNINRLRQGIGFVFQQFNLFPHMSALENVMYAPVQIQKQSKADARVVAQELLERVGLAHKADAYPGSLSGGHQQRVAIARALALKPTVMRFDEPTSALDPQMAGEFLQVMKALARAGMTMCCVTHELGFARKIADRMIFMDAGEIIEDSPTDSFFTAPASVRARDFLEQIIHH